MDNASPLVALKPRRRGRPKNTFRTVSVNVRITTTVFDAYDRTARRSGQSIHAVLRHVLTLHAPPSDAES